MVGDPKTLHDLSRIEAQVQVTCRSCKAVEVWDLDSLIAEVRKNGGSTDWRAARGAIKCPARCPAPRISLLPIPYGKRKARTREHRHALVNLALQILRAAAWRSSKVAVGTVEVRLALHVLRPMLGDAKPLTAYWEKATELPRHPWTSCHLPYRWIVQQLIERGAEVDPTNLP